MYSVKSGLRKALYMYSTTPFSRFENEECSSCFALRGMHFLSMFVSRFTGRMSSAELFIICNGNRTEWSPIRSVIIRVITKSDDRAAGVRFVYHEYDYRQNWTTRSLITN